MWQKAVAAALVLCGTQGFGYALCQEMQCILYHDTEQKQMLLYMTREISFLHRPMQEIFDHMGERLGEPYREMVQTIAGQMAQDDGCSLHTLWKRELEKLAASHQYPRQALQHLGTMGECFGCEEDEMQIASFGLLLQELEEEIENIKSRKAEKCRLIQTLSLLAGIFCVVLFL